MSLTKHARALRYRLHNPAKWDYAPTAKKPHIIVTLTSVPSRIARTQPTIISLLKQTHRPSHIEMNLALRPKTQDGDWQVPKWLMQLQTVKIHWLEHDYGPASKLIPTLERHANEDCLIIVVDDDMIYPKRLIEQLYAADQQAQGTKVFCANGHTIPKNHHFFASPSDKRLKSGTKRVAIIEGCGGYSVRSVHFDLDALKALDAIPTQAAKMDDIWFSGHLSKRSIEKVQIATGRRYSLPQAQVPAITGVRTKASNMLLDFFANDWHEYEYAKNKHKQEA